MPKKPYNYRIDFKHERYFPQAYLDKIQEHVWRFLGDVVRSDITIKLMTRSKKEHFTRIEKAKNNTLK